LRLTIYYVSEDVDDLELRPEYFMAWHPAANHWNTLLPFVINNIRARLGLRNAPVGIVPAYDPTVREWHRPLLERLYGPLPE
jgi:hypothetical protein